MKELPWEELTREQQRERLHFAIVRAAFAFEDYLQTKGHEEELEDRFSGYCLLKHELNMLRIWDKQPIEGGK